MGSDQLLKSLFFNCCGKSGGRRIFLTQDGLTNQGKKAVKMKFEDQLGEGGGSSSRAEPLLSVTGGIKPLLQSLGGTTD